MSNIIDTIQVSGVTYQIQGSGGGKAIKEGRGISVTTGETADTVSFNLPISAGTGSYSIIEGLDTTASGYYSHAEGQGTIASGNYGSHAEGQGTIASGQSSHAEGTVTQSNGNSSHAEGFYATANGSSSHAEGYNTNASGYSSHAEGNNTKANNQSEHASGQYNVSSSASTTFGHSGNTLFSVGNGTSNSARHNAFEIRQNGDIYLSSGGTDIKLQDHLGGGGSVTVDTELDSGSTNPVQNQALYNELRLNVTEETETLLQWEQYDGGESTNYPSGCTKITVEVDENEMTYGAYTLYNNNYDCFGVFVIESNGGVITVSATDCESEPTTSITYSISDNVVTIEYPTITNVTIIGTSYDNYWTIKAISGTSTVTPLIDQVSANTTALAGKQTTLTAGTGIDITDNVISATGGGNPTVELTQAEYNALVTAGTVSADTYYIITDAQAGDLTQYWTSAQTQSAITQSVSGKQDTLSAGTNITIVDNVISAEGGGKAIEAGRGISITTGATADTVSFNLPISAGTGTNSIKENYINNIASGAYSHVEGSNSTASGERSHAEGYYSTASGSYSHTEGQNCYARKISSHAEGTNTDAKENYSHTEGFYTIANNQSEHASGQYNVSSKASTTFGDSGNTIFSVGNGTADNARHNAFEIRQNGDIYLNNGTSDVKLQEYLQIKAVKVTQAEYDALVQGGTVDANTLYIITNVVS